jgi:hypothetical protein
LIAGISKIEEGDERKRKAGKKIVAGDAHAEPSDSVVVVIVGLYRV